MHGNFFASRRVLHIQVNICIYIFNFKKNTSKKLQKIFIFKYTFVIVFHAASVDEIHDSVLFSMFVILFMRILQV